MSRSADELTDVELARGARAGSHACFEELVRRYETPIYRFIKSRIGNSQDAEDLAQTSFITAFRKIRRYNDAYPFRAWLFAIARRQAISHYRRNRRGPLLPSQDEAVDADDPSKELAARDAIERVWETARAVLPGIQFTVLWLRYQEEMPLTEIARVTGKTVTNVKVILCRGRRALAGALGRDAERREQTRSADRPAGKARARSAPRYPGELDSPLSCQEGAS